MEKNELTERKEALPTSSHSVTRNTYTNYGGVQAGEINNLTINFNNITNDEMLALFQQMMKKGTCNPIEMQALSHAYYHLFVLKDEFYSDGSFSISVDICLKHTEEKVIDEYYRLDNTAFTQLLKYPAVFTTINHSHKSTDEQHIFMVGKIDSISRRGTTLKFEFRTDGTTHFQQRLNEHIRDFDMEQSYCDCELDDEHWAIKECDLLGEMARLEI